MNRNDINELRRVLAPLVRKLNTIISRGEIKITDDSGDYQTMQIESMDKTRDDVMRMQQYGFYSRPPVNSEALVVNIAGNNFQMVIAVDNPSTRKKDLQEKEMGMFHEEGHFVHMKNGDEVHAKASNTRVETSQMVIGSSSNPSGRVLTTLSDPIADYITGKPHEGCASILTDLI